jgi:pimeloyl-ACP methyl ester carboxylesterase
MPQVHANGIHIEYESFGEASAPTILLIMGLAGQLVHWPDDFCGMLAQAGFRVIRFDNRDIGLSTKLDHSGRPKLMRTALAATFRLPVKVPYLLDDMARDALGLMDALQVKTAHIVGASMGGMIGQILAAKHAVRVRSLVSVMSTSGNPWLPQASLQLRLRLIRRRKRDRESLIEDSMLTWRMIGSPGYPQEDKVLRAKVERGYDRSYHPPGLVRQTAAIIASGSRVPILRRIAAPTLIIHGADDPLVPVAAAHDLMKHIAGAKLEIIPGMGHDLPPALVPRLAQSILRHVKQAEHSHGQIVQQGARREARGGKR